MLRLVGSALYKENPRDWDLILVLPDDIFERLYMNPLKFKAEGQSGNWSPPRWRWADDSVAIGRMIANLSGKNIDLTVVPESMEHGLDLPAGRPRLRERDPAKSVKYYLPQSYRDKAKDYGFVGAFLKQLTIALVDTVESTLSEHELEVFKLAVQVGLLVPSQMVPNPTAHGTASNKTATA